MEELIFIENKDKTSEVFEYHFLDNTIKLIFKSNRNKVYTYGKDKVAIYRFVENLPIENVQFSRGNEIVYNNISSAKKYCCKDNVKIQLNFKNGNQSIINFEDLVVEKSVLASKKISDVFDYLKQLSTLNEIHDEYGNTLLSKNYSKINFISSKTVLAHFLSPSTYKDGRKTDIPDLIFPFGCNNSQYQATRLAMTSQISLIQGPPGTGKTQTILNILSNVLYQNKTALVVSNNNSAIDNISEKFALPDIKLDFLIATLGSRKNQEHFLNSQVLITPDYLSNVSNNMDGAIAFEDLKKIFRIREQLAELRSELSVIEVEYDHFRDYLLEKDISDIDLLKLSPKKTLELLSDCEKLFDNYKKIGFMFKLKSLFKYRIKNFNLYEQDPIILSAAIQKRFYDAKLLELKNRLLELENKYQQIAGNNQLQCMSDLSKSILKQKLFQKYNPGSKREQFQYEDLRGFQSSNRFLEEYPIVLSTTFSAKNSLHQSIVYDYLIIDEASQVDMVTGALALSCAKNVVIVGDMMQLPNIITTGIEREAEIIRKELKIKPCYSLKNSFLKVMVEVFPNAPQTLLREHYRCHPKIIQFCNQKFYNGQLYIMTEDRGEKNVLLAYRSVEGNHERRHTNQREVDIIKQEVIEYYQLDKETTGLISPYRNQVNLLQQHLNGFTSDTVHKFQGREYETMILSTVDNYITRFTDDPHLLNVAVSRAKDRLILVTSGNQQRPEKNISDLLGYIDYQNCDIKDSKLYSVFDYLYKQYEERRNFYFKNKEKHSKYDSENLMYELIKEVLIDYPDLEVGTQYRLYHLLKDFSLLTDEETQFVKQGRTSVDFLIFNKITKYPILAIEVDGYKFHNTPEQKRRDRLKDNILEKYQISLLRFPTNGSQEKQQLATFLDSYEKN